MYRSQQWCLSNTCHVKALTALVEPLLEGIICAEREFIISNNCSKKIGLNSSMAGFRNSHVGSRSWLLSVARLAFTVGLRF